MNRNEYISHVYYKNILEINENKSETVKIKHKHVAEWLKFIGVSYMFVDLVEMYKQTTFVAPRLTLVGAGYVWLEI